MGALIRYVCCIIDFFAAPISRRRDCGLAFATADDFYAQMVDCYEILSLFLVE